jgi:hypothetical protein
MANSSEPIYLTVSGDFPDYIIKCGNNKYKVAVF